MIQLEVASANVDDNPNYSLSFVRFLMKGKHHTCVFTIDGYDFSKPFSEKMKRLIDDETVTETCGHDFDPAFVTKRHIPILDDVDMSKFNSGFFDSEHVHGCKYCEMHFIYP